jgi:hypothetical protein
MGHAFLYYFDKKKVFYLKMLSACKSVASMADEKNMSLGYWWNYTGREGGGSLPVPHSPPQNPHRLDGDRTRMILLVVGSISKRRWSTGILAVIREWQIGKALKYNYSLILGTITPFLEDLRKVTKNAVRISINRCRI